MKKLTEADYARIRAEAAAIRDRALGLCIDIPPEQKLDPLTRRGSSRKGIHMPSRPTYDRDSIKKLYSDGMKVQEIADKLGCHRGTVSRILGEMGVEKRNSSGPRRREKCEKGHSMEDAIPCKGGGRACRECKRIRDREGARRRYHEKKRA